MTPGSEQELLDQTIELAMLRKWAVCHVRPARTADGWRTPIQGHKGWPDLALARDGVLLLRELKGPKGFLSPEQRDWARQISPGWLELRGVVPDDELSLRFDVWRPEHWSTRIIPTLTAPRATRRSA